MQGYHETSPVTKEWISCFRSADRKQMKGWPCRMCVLIWALGGSVEGVAGGGCQCLLAMALPWGSVKHKEAKIAG